MQTLRLGRLACALAVVLAPDLAHAQTVPTLQMTTGVLDHPTTGGPVGAATQVALGQLSDDAVPDAAVLHGSGVHFLYAVDRRNAWAPVSGNYTSIATLPKYADGDRDALIATSSSGLVILSFDSSPSVRTLVPAAQSGTSAWAAATDLQVVPTTADQYEVLALDSATRSILRLGWNPGTGVFTTMTPISVDTGTTALAGLQWDTDTALEYATASPTGMEVYDSAGSVLTSIADAGSDPLLIAVTDAGVPHRVAWMRSPASLVEKLTVVLASGSSEPAQWYYGVDVQHLALIDLGEDSRKELWLTSGQATIGIGLRRDSVKTFLAWPANLAFGVDLDVARSALVPNPHPAPGPGSGVYGGANTPPVPAVMDLDGDGDDDLFLAGHPGQADRAMVLFGDVFDEERNILDDRPVRPWMSEYSFQVSGTYGGPQTGQLDFVIPGAPTAGPAMDATHVRHIVWTQAAGSSVLNLVGVLETPMSGIPPAPTIWIPNIHSLGNLSTIHLEVSYLERDSAGLMTAALPAWHEKFQVDLEDLELRVFRDVALGLDGSSTSGSTQRPPISPPTGNPTP